MTTDISEQLSKRVGKLEELNRLAQVLSGTEGVADTLAAILRCSQSLCGAEHGSILLFDPEEESEVHTILRDNGSAVQPIDHRLNKYVAGHILKFQKPFVAENVVAMAGFTNPSARLLAFGPAMAVPLSANGRVIGMIHLVNPTGSGPFTAAQVRAAEIVANMASQFIVRARVHESLRKDIQGVHPIIGTSEAMRKVLADIRLVAPSSASVLVYTLALGKLA